VSTPSFLALPPGATARSVSTPRGSFAAHVAGDPGHPTALLVAGFTGSKEDYIAVLEPLAAAGFHVVAIDQRGQYETPGPASEQGWTLEGFGADLVAVAAAVSETPVHLLGHSFGGLVAREAVLADPSGFASLVLLCSGPAALPADQAALLQRFAVGIDALGLAGVWPLKHALDVENGWQPSADPRIDAFMEARFLANDPGCLAAMARILATAEDRTDELAKVDLPTLVALGVEDDAWPPKIQEETASRLGAELVFFPKAAHSPAAESPGSTAEALADFWDRAEGTG
jgi:pimeloyl-ACP methyl ester carboxylesterase